ncbi:beta-sarcoglycan-like [Patiria miniata]|uniref:Beta-sarcoglycan n=1 Tax=Patiria miniata TaxID=46514 RepID=A0A914A4D5_PATMI|nr:beta-sarcoglycan-like [Patiria miniata]
MRMSKQCDRSMLLEHTFRIFLGVYTPRKIRKKRCKWYSSQYPSRLTYIVLENGSSLSDYWKEEMATSAYQRGTNGHQSMLEKSLERRRVNKEHNSNFRAGHVPVHEEHLHKTGLRGRKRYFAYCFLAMVYITAVGNLVITALMMWTLRIDMNGLQSLQFLRGGLVRFLDEVDIDTVVTSHGEIGGFMGQDLEISGQRSTVRVVAHEKPAASVEVSNGETIMRGQKGLKVISPRSGATIFHTDASKEAILPTKMDTMQSSLITANKIVSDTEEDLRIMSNASVELLGSEVLQLSSKQLNADARDILITSMSTLILDGSVGTFLNTTLLPKASGSVGNRPKATVFKLCVCKTSGRVFQVRVQSGVQHPCANLDSSFNLCT